MTTGVILGCVIELLGTQPARACARVPRARVAAQALASAGRHAPGVPLAVAAAVGAAESGFDPRAIGARGELGMFQVKRGGAVRGRWAALTDDELLEPRVNARVALAYMKRAMQRCGSDPERWLSFYNWPARGCVPSRYSRRVLALLGNPTVAVLQLP